jgi:hypothetical protein
VATVPLVIRSNWASPNSAGASMTQSAPFAAQGRPALRQVSREAGAFHHVQALVLHRFRECREHKVPSTAKKRAHNCLQTLLMSSKRVVLRAHEYWLDQYLLIADSWLTTHGYSSVNNSADG